MQQDYIKTHDNQIDIKNTVIQHHISTIEDLSLSKRNLEIEVKTLKSQYDSLKIDFEDSVKTIHNMNRFKHELELKLQAEKVTVEQQHVTILQKEKEVYVLGVEI